MDTVRFLLEAERLLGISLPSQLVKKQKMNDYDQQVVRADAIVSSTQSPIPTLNMVRARWAAVDACFLARRSLPIGVPGSIDDATLASLNFLRSRGNGESIAPLPTGFPAETPMALRGTIRGFADHTFRVPALRVARCHLLLVRFSATITHLTLTKVLINGRPSLSAAALPRRLEALYLTNVSLTDAQLLLELRTLRTLSVLCGGISGASDAVPQALWCAAYPFLPASLVIFHWQMLLKDVFFLAEPPTTPPRMLLPNLLELSVFDASTFAVTAPKLLTLILHAPRQLRTHGLVYDALVASPSALRLCDCTGPLKDAVLSPDVLRGVKTCEIAYTPGGRHAPMTLAPACYPMMTNLQRVHFSSGYHPLAMRGAKPKEAFYVADAAVHAKNVMLPGDGTVPVIIKNVSFSRKAFELAWKGQNS